MSNRLIAKRYAKALVEIGDMHGDLVVLQHELGEVVELVRGNADLLRLVANPLVLPAQKAYVFDAVLRQAGISMTLGNFFKVVTEGGRLNLIYDIEQAFNALVDEKAGVVEATAVSAAPLSAAQAAMIQSALGKKIGKSIRLIQEVDPGLLGGLKVQVGSTVYDASLQGQLHQLKTQLLSA